MLLYIGRSSYGEAIGIIRLAFIIMHNTVIL